MHKRIIVAFAIGIAFMSLAVAAVDLVNPFKIKAIRRTTKHVVYVDNGWKNLAPCIEANIQVTQAIEGTFYVKAYFFDKDKKLLEEQERPTQVSDDYRSYTSVPVVLKPREVNKVFFPIGARAQKWSKVIIVFGNAQYAVADSNPHEDVASFEFKEKELVLKTRKENEASAKSNNP